MAKPGDRQDYFQIVDHAFANLLVGSAGRARRAADDVEASLNDIPASEVGPRVRVAEYAAFYHAMADSLTATAQSLRDKD